MLRQALPDEVMSHSKSSYVLIYQKVEEANVSRDGNEDIIFDNDDHIFDNDDGLDDNVELNDLNEGSNFTDFNEVDDVEFDEDLEIDDNVKVHEKLEVHDDLEFSNDDEADLHDSDNHSIEPSPSASEVDNLGENLDNAGKH